MNDETRNSFGGGTGSIERVTSNQKTPLKKKLSPPPIEVAEAIEKSGVGGGGSVRVVVVGQDRGENYPHETDAMMRPPQKPVSSVLDTVVVVALWYASNIGVLILNKLLMSRFDFKFPFFLTACHMLSSSVLSSFVVGILKVVPSQPIYSRAQASTIVLLAAIFCGSILAGNASLRFLPVSFNQMVGATTPFFTAVLAFFILGTVETKEVYLALVPVVFGVMISSGGEPQFHLVGLIICIISTAGRALKSVLQALLMSNPEEKLDSVNLLRYMAPVALVILFPLTILFEDTRLIAHHFSPTTNERYFLFTTVLLINSLTAYFVNLLNFLVTKKTNALTLQVLGNAKGLFATVISVAIFRNPLTFQSVLGYGITLTGVALYSTFKRQSKK